MRNKRKIFSYFLLSSYLLVLAHHSISHSHVHDHGENNVQLNSHKHEGHNTVHHEHTFHVGIFHYLGHLFEGIDHHSNLDNEYLNSTGSKQLVKAGDQPVNVNHFCEVFQLIDVDEKTKYNFTPQYYFIRLQRLKQACPPLRAPPCQV